MKVFELLEMLKEMPDVDLHNLDVRLVTRNFNDDRTCHQHWAMGIRIMEDCVNIYGEI